MAIVTYHHTVGENGLGLNRPGHYYQIIQEVLLSAMIRWHRKLYIVGWTAWQIWHWLGRRRWWHVWWHIHRYNRCSMKIVMMIYFWALNKFADFSASYTQVRLWGGFIGPKIRCVLYTHAACNQVYTVLYLFQKAFFFIPTQRIYHCWFVFFYKWVCICYFKNTKR